MSEVEAQYEAYPYPERDPADEAKRLITGSPSHPIELDHHLFGGLRDWSAGTRILVAGGGTGDALIQLAQVLADAGKPHEIVYLDLSTASRAIAEARAEVRGLDNIQFETGSLLDATEYGVFDYIDCCGVLHHLPKPQEGFDALAGALAPGGGMGLMVYAPYGRSGVYPLQEAFGAMTQGLSPKGKLDKAKEIFAAIPSGHPFKKNTNLVDHQAGDAGFFDLLLHSQDRPFTIGELAQVLGAAGLTLAGMPQANLYDLSRFVEVPQGMDAISQMAVAERLDGTIKTHVVYARRSVDPEPSKFGDRCVPHLKGVSGPDLARQVASKGRITVTVQDRKEEIRIPKGIAPVLAGINGERELGALKGSVPPLSWAADWPRASSALISYGLLMYSRLLR